MSLVQAVILGALQGLTEFVPVSSTAHLYLAARDIIPDQQRARTFPF